MTSRIGNNLTGVTDSIEKMIGFIFRVNLEILGCLNWKSSSSIARARYKSNARLLNTSSTSFLFYAQLFTDE